MGLSTTRCALVTRSTMVVVQVSYKKSKYKLYIIVTSSNLSIHVPSALKMSLLLKLNAAYQRHPTLWVFRINFFIHSLLFSLSLGPNFIKYEK